MPQYWIRQNAADEVQGPFDSATVRRMVRGGSVGRDWLISPDQQAWHRAGQVKGLFEPAAAVRSAAASHVPVAPPADATPRDSASAAYATPRAASAPAIVHEAAAEAVAVLPPPMPPATAQAIEYFGTGSGAVTSGVTAPSAAMVLAFQIVATLMFLSWATCITFAFLEKPVVALIALGCMFIFCIPALVLWVVWLYQAHKTVRAMSGGVYGVSPAMAAGFSFIPLFSGFWVVYMPMKLAGELNRLAGENIVSVPAVMTMQILSILTALFAAGLTPVFYAVSMFLVQRSIQRILAA